MPVYPQESLPADRRATSARPTQASSSSSRPCAASSSTATSTRLPIRWRILTPDTNACWPHGAAPCALHLHPCRPIDHSNRCKRPAPPTTAVPPTSTPSSRASTAPRRRCTTRHRSWPRQMLAQQPHCPPPLTHNMHSIYPADTNRRTIRLIIRDSTLSNRTEVRRCSYRNQPTTPIPTIPVIDLLSPGEVGSGFGCPC